MHFKILFLFLFLSLKTIAQNASLTITINTSKGKEVNSIANATVILKNLKDSSTVSTKQSNATGVAIFNVTKNEKYFIEVSSVGYQTAIKSIAITNTTNNLFITLPKKVVTNSMATVVGKKPIMRQEDDKTIVDAELLANTSNNAFEVIEKTPGAIMDQDGNIYLASMQPATIQINGRDVKMGASDLATILKSLPANSISRIEMLRSPSAKYESSNSGGIINIVLKKGIKLGLNGSVNLGHFQGKYGATTTGFSLYNNNKSNYYFTYQYNDRNSFDNINSLRKFSSTNSFLSQIASTTFPSQTHFASGGVEKELSKKFTINLDTRFSNNGNKGLTKNTTDIKNQTTGTLLSNSLSGINNDTKSKNWNTSINGKLKIDSIGSEWTFLTEYTINDSKLNQFYNNYFASPVSALQLGDGTITNNRNIFVLQSDLKYKTKDKYIVESGFKFNNTIADNTANFFTQNATTPRINDFSRTTTFDYKEKINAFYAMVGKTFTHGFTVKGGFRYEQTNLTGTQTIPSISNFSIKRNDLFPYFFVSKTLFKIMGFDLSANLVYRKSISRPSFDILNPYEKIIDPYLIESGNPNLKPQFTTHYEFNIVAGGYPFISVGYNDAKDLFSSVTYQNDVTKIANRTYDNLGKNKELYVRIIGGIPPSSKGFAFVGFQHNFNAYNGFYQGAPLDYKRGTWTFFTHNQYKFSKTFNAGINGFMRLKSLQNFYEVKTFGQLGINLTKTLKENRFSITVAGNDILRTMKFDLALQQGNIFATGTRFSDSRRFGLTLRYNFGIKPKEKKESMFEQKVPE